MSNERFERIMEAFHKAVAGRDPTAVKVGDVLPGIFADVPPTPTRRDQPGLPCRGTDIV